jgi:hypothetical protein
MTREQARYNLGEIDFLNREAAEDAAHDDEFLTDEELAERDETETEESAA